MSSRAGSWFNKSQLANSGRIAGFGMIEDDYSECSYGGCSRNDHGGGGVVVRLPNDHIKPEDLNGECIVVQKGKRKD